MPRIRAQSIGEVLERALENLGISGKLRAQRAVTEWADIVGPAIAAHAVAEKISGGVLQVRVDDAVWRAELHLRREEICAKVNARAGEEIVRDIRLT